MPIYLQIIGIVVDLLKQIAWPVAAFFIALLFRNELRSLLPKLRRLGPTGVEFEGSGQQVRAGTASIPGDLKELPGFTRSNAIADLERRLHNELNSSDHKIEDREHVLIRLLAEAQLVAHFEQTYRAIFGSQISALRELNAAGKVSESRLHEFFESARNQYASLYEGYGYEQWIDFLVRQKLIKRLGNTIEITDTGRDFLVYMTLRGIPENKLF
jgi:hypothetical protein